MELLLENAIGVELSGYEIERGKPMPSKNHSIVQSNILIELGPRYRKAYSFLSELTLSMPSKPNCVPDISIYHKIKGDFLHDDVSMEEMPITAIEIVSKSQSDEEILAKFERYFFAGVQSCWLVMPSLKAISVYSQIGVYEFYKDGMTLFDEATDIELPLSEIFN